MSALFKPKTSSNDLLILIEDNSGNIQPRFEKKASNYNQASTDAPEEDNAIKIDSKDSKEGERGGVDPKNRPEEQNLEIGENDQKSDEQRLKALRAEYKKAKELTVLVARLKEEPKKPKYAYQAKTQEPPKIREIRAKLDSFKQPLTEEQLADLMEQIKTKNLLKSQISTLSQKIKKKAKKVQKKEKNNKKSKQKQAKMALLRQLEEDRWGARVDRYQPFLEHVRQEQERKESFRGTQRTLNTQKTRSRAKLLTDHSGNFLNTEMSMEPNEGSFGARASLQSSNLLPKGGYMQKRVMDLLALHKFYNDQKTEEKLLNKPKDPYKVFVYKPERLEEPMEVEKVEQNENFQNREKALFWKGEYFDGSTYHGNYQNDRPEGYGIGRYQSRGVYKGNWKNGREHGFGRFWCKNGDFYAGQWVLGVINGQGVFRFGDKGVYEGNFYKGIFDGFGSLELPNGERYKGGFVGGLYHGYGALFLADGSSFEGNFRRGVFQGNGVLRNFRHVLRYEGMFEEGVRTGYGLEITQWGYIYKGSFLGGLRHGYGRLALESYLKGGERVDEGDKHATSAKIGSKMGKNGKFGKMTIWYKGQFFEGLKHGKGTELLTGGVLYKGEYKNDLRHGNGHLILKKSKREYKGEFAKNQPNGFGETFSRGRKVFEGCFKGGKMNGKGVKFLANGRRLEGVWVDGKMAKKMKLYEMKDFEEDFETRNEYFLEVSRLVETGKNRAKRGGVVGRGEIGGGLRSKVSTRGVKSGQKRKKGFGGLAKKKGFGGKKIGTKTPVKAKSKKKTEFKLEFGDGESLGIDFEANEDIPTNKVSGKKNGYNLVKKDLVKPKDDSLGILGLLDDDEDDFLGGADFGRPKGLKDFQHDEKVEDDGFDFGTVAKAPTGPKKKGDSFFDGFGDEPEEGSDKEFLDLF